MRTILLLFLLSPLSSLAQNDHAQQCQSVAAVDLPQEAAVAAPTVFPACHAYKSYSGIDRRVDYRAARACAWKERLAQHAGLSQNASVGTSWVIGGDLILVDLYANGLGVPRNLPLALHLACEDGAGIAADAIDALDRLSKVPQPSAKRFEVCDSAFSTFSMNFCESFHLELAEERRHRSILALSARWSKEQKTAFAKVQSAEEKYVGAHNGELDASGTIRALRNMGSAEIMHQNFFLDLRQFEKGNTPKGSASDAIKEEERMLAQYKTNLTAAQVPLTEDSQDGVTADGVTQAQGAWQEYRDAWLAFTAVRYPSIPASAFRAYFCEERLHLLAAMRGQIYRD